MAIDEQLKTEIVKFLSNQTKLSYVFEKVLYDNLWDLYEVTSNG